MTHPDQSTTAWTAVSPDVSEQALKQQLTAAGVPLGDWGRGAAKTLQNLLKEVREGESVVSFNSGGAVLRQVGVVWVDVLHLAANGSVHLLSETRQEYRDGRSRTRNLPASLGEKMKAGEAPIDAASRAICEELGVEEPNTLHFLSSQETHFTPDSYPGLASRYDTHSYVATLGAAAFNTDGYIEKQVDKINYYDWDIIRPQNERG